MRKLIPWVALFLSIAALMLSFANMLERSAAKPVEAKAPDIQYVMYLGTNDKDTYAPAFAPDEAKTQLDAVLSRHLGRSATTVLLLSSWRRSIQSTGTLSKTPSFPWATLRRRRRCPVSSRLRPTNPNLSFWPTRNL